jgi:hypothetical protein
VGVLLCLGQQEATDLVRFCLGPSGKTRPGKHFREELAKEGLAMVDAEGVLRTGQVFDSAEQDLRTGEWKYRLEGHEPGGKWLIIVLCFKAIDEMFLISVFSNKARKRKP